MQTQKEIRQLLEEAHLSPQKRFGQNFLVDKNLMGKLLELAQPAKDQTVLEVGPGTGSLTEELLPRARKVVAVEIDVGLAGILRGRLGASANLALIQGDVLASKHQISPAVLEALGGSAVLVSNLPYNIATPLLAECLLSSWRVVAGKGGCRFDRLTFTVQREVADRLTAANGSDAYGPVSVLGGLLGRWTLGPVVPASAFWPRPAVASRMVRIDFDPAAAARLVDAEILTTLLGLVFGHRRKQIGAIFRKHAGGLSAAALQQAAERADVDPAIRAEQLTPQQFLVMVETLAAAPGGAAPPEGPAAP